MKSDLKTRHGGRILADALAGHGTRVAFGVPGESFLPVLDGLHDLKDKLKFVICRQEGGASYMADAWAKLTGEPGVLLRTTPCQHAMYAYKYIATHVWGTGLLCNSCVAA